MSRALGAALLLLTVAGVARAEIADRIVATIDGEPITAHEVRQWGKERGLQEAPDTRVLDLLITEKLLQKEIKSQGIAAREEEIDRYIEEIQARNGVDKERFQKILSDQGMTYEAYHAKVK